MDHYDKLNKMLVYLFDHTIEIESRLLISGRFKDISVNDMHIIDAIGPHNHISMTLLAKRVGVTVGTLTIAINNLVKKSYVNRERSDEDRRVVLISLSSKGEEAFRHHANFHRKMAEAMRSSLTEEECLVLVRSLTSLTDYFEQI